MRIKLIHSHQEKHRNSVFLRDAESHDGFICKVYPCKQADYIAAVIKRALESDPTLSLDSIGLMRQPKPHPQFQSQPCYHCGSNERTQNNTCANCGEDFHAHYK